MAFSTEGMTPGMIRNLVDSWKGTRGSGMGGSYELPEGLESDEEILAWVEKTHNPYLGLDLHDTYEIDGPAAVKEVLREAEREAQKDSVKESRLISKSPFLDLVRKLAFWANGRKKD